MKDHNVIIKAAVRLLVSIASSSLLVFQAVAQNAPLPLIEVTTPIQLNPNLGANQNVTDFKISPDNEHVVYIADQNDDEVFELYSAKMDGSTPPIKLSITNPVSEGDVLNIAGFSADGSRVLYSADQLVDGVDEIFSASLDGASRTRITPAVSGLLTIVTMVVLPENDRILYITRTGSSFSPSDDLFSIALDGSSLHKLTDNFPSGTPRQLQAPSFSDDLSMVAYGVRVNDERRIYVSNTDGTGPSTRVDGNGNGQDLVAAYEISKNNTHVVYLANQDVTESFELYSSPISGGTVIKLNSPLPFSGDVLDYRLNSHNPNYVYYIAEQTVTAREELFGVPLTGGAIIRLSPSVTEESDARFISANGEVISYRFVDRAPALNELTLRGILAATNTSFLISERIALLDFFTVIASNSGNYLTFLARNSGSSLRRLFSLSTTRGDVTNNRILISEGNSNTLGNYIRSISADDRLVAYTADNLNVANSLNLFITSLREGQPARVTPDLPNGSNITKVSISQNNSHTVYLADQATVGKFNIYSSALTISEPVNDDLCLPIPTSSGSTAVICL